MKVKPIRISLQSCDWFPKTRQLVTSSELFAGTFPRIVEVESHYTNRVITFVPIPPGHDWYNEDQYDGEEQHYIPTDNTDNRVEELIVMHHF